MYAHDMATRRLGWVFGATVLLFAVEALAAFYTRSMALTADSDCPALASCLPAPQLPSTT